MRIPIWTPDYNRLGKYAALGINAIWMNEGTTPSNITAVDYYSRAKSLSMEVWAYPNSFLKNPGANLSSSFPDRLALLDEPVMHGKTPADMIAQRDTFLKSIIGTKPFVMNIEGDKFSRFAPAANAKPEEISAWKNINAQQGPFATVIPDNPDNILFFDFYIKNRVRYLPTVTDPTAYTWYDFTNLFASIDFLKQYRQEIGVIVECSNQCIDKNSRCPSRGEWRGEVYGSLIWGAKHIGFFVQRPDNKPANWEKYGDPMDAMPPYIEAELGIFTKFVADFWPMLQAAGPQSRSTNDPLYIRNFGKYSLRLNLSKNTIGNYAPYEVQLLDTGTLMWRSNEQAPSNPAPPTPIPAPPVPVLPNPIDALQKAFDGLKADYDSLNAKYLVQTGNLQSLQADYDKLNEMYQEKRDALTELQNAMKVITKYGNSTTT